MKNFLLASTLFLTAMSVAGLASAAGGARAHNTQLPATSHALANSNGTNSLDKDKGLDRAEDRRNSQSLNHKLHKTTHKKKSKKVPDMHASHDV
ncbi:MAG: hypothetical protein V4488_13780 [Pseudomonadota bacterium]